MNRLREMWRRMRAALGGERGFTLTELAVVIAIIGILAAAAVPTYRASRDSAYKSEAKNIISELRSLSWSYRLEKNAWTTVLADLNFTPPGGKFDYALATTGTGLPAGALRIKATGATGQPTAGWVICLDVLDTGQVSGDFKEGAANCN